LCQPNIAKNNAPHENSNPQPNEAANFETMDCLDPPPEPMSNAEDARRIIDLDNRVNILKQQVITTLDKVEKSAGLEAIISSLEEQVLTFSSRITELTDGGQYMTDLFERASEQLECKFFRAPEYFSSKYILTSSPFIQVLA
jgi:hypothetical protein